MNEFRKHQDGKSQEMQSFQGIRQAFVITGQTAKTTHPAEATFHDPTTREQNKTFLGIGEFDHNKLNALLRGGLLRLVAGIALIHKSDLNVLTRHFLYLPCQWSDLRSILFVDRSHMQGQQVAGSGKH